MSKDDETDDSYPPSVILRSNPDTGKCWPDAMSLLAYRQAMAAKRYREACGITERPPATEPGMIDTAPFAGRCCITAKVWPPGSPHSVRLLAVSAGDLSAEARDKLRAAGVEVDDAKRFIPLGRETALGRPRSSIALAEIVALVEEERAKK
jgi:hypothetical protein